MEEFVQMFDVPAHPLQPGREPGGAEVSLAKLRISSGGSSGRNLVIEYDGKRLEPFSGQLLLKFEAGATKLRPMRERSRKRSPQ